MFILAPLTDGGRRYLWCVSRVLGKHSVQVICHTGDMLMESEMRTHGIHDKRNDTVLVNYRDSQYPELGAFEVYELERKD